MTPEQFFELGSSLALVGWVLLAFVSPFWFKVPGFINGIIVVLLAACYAWLILSNFNAGDFQKFSTVEGVQELFQDKQMLVAGWIHYLAFDLFIGTWIVLNARKHAINHWLTVPSLFLTFFLGPIGWLTYFLLRFAVTRNYFSEN